MEEITAYQQLDNNKIIKLFMHFLKLQFQMGALSKSHLASLAALGLAGMGPTSNGAINPTGELKTNKFMTNNTLKF